MVDEEFRPSHLFVYLERAVRRGAIGVIVLLAVTLLPFVPAQAAPSGAGGVKDLSVPVSRLKPRKPGVSQSDVDQWRPQSATTLPEGGSAVLDVVAQSPATAVGGLPVRVAPDGSAGSPQRVRVEVLDRAKSEAAAIPVVLRLDRADAGPARARARVEVDYSGFRASYGADWASRLRLAEVKPCVLAGSVPDCPSPRFLPGANDAIRGVVSASVEFAGATDSDVNSLSNPVNDSADVMLAVMAAAEGETGSFTRTSLSESYGWQAGRSSGDFSFSYPVDAPPSAGDLDPEVSFAYSSGAVDGRTNAESGQTSWLGEGWSYDSGYIERSYRACKDDQSPAPRYTNATGDLCWRQNNATLVWRGQSTELIRDDATGAWRLADDDGSRLELLQDGADWNAANRMLSPGDFDGDGKADAMFRREADGDLYLVRGDGAGGWLNAGAATRIGSFGGADIIFSPGDFTGDGNSDVLWWRSSDGTLWLLKGNGAGGWISGTSEQIGTFSAADLLFGHGDFSGDGKPDVLWRRASDGALFMMRGNGLGRWVTGLSEQIGTSWDIHDLIFSPGDFNGDGKVDVIARNASTKNMFLYTGNGAGGWASGATQISSGPSSADIIFSGGDHDGDAKADVMWRQASSKDVFLLTGNGTGGWKNGTSVNITENVRHKNGDDNGEHWRLTTQDGTQFYFGRSRLPGWSSGQRETNSVWTVPVFANHIDEACQRNSGFAASYCSQAWRWNLDHVVDPHQNSMSYWYSKDQARTGLNGNASLTAVYERGGWLDRIEYGTRLGQEVSGTPPMRVVFTTADRCLSSCWSGSTPVTANWPDTPWDLHCAVSATSCSTNVSPSFWTTKRLATVTTQVWNGSSHDPVDEWALTHTFPGTAETSVSPALWMSNIVQTGKDGGTQVLPKLDFGGVRYANRTDHNVSLGVPLVYRYRITRVTNEHGGETDITYEGSDCTVSSQADPDTNTKRCFPQYYYPPAAPAPGWSWWNKYRVTKVVEKDLVGGGPDVEESYAYSTDGSSTNVLWHHNDGAAMWSSALAQRSWSDFRGWSTVTVTSGVAGQTERYSERVYPRVR